MPFINELLADNQQQNLRETPRTRTSRFDFEPEAIAQRLIDSTTDEGERIDLAYTLTLGRPATTLERERSLALLHDIGAGLNGKNDQERQGVAWATLAQSLIASAEFRYLN